MVPGRKRSIVTISVAAVLGVALFLFGLLALIGSFTESSGVNWNTATVALVILLASGLCGIWIVHLEHRLRGHPAGKPAAIGARRRRGAPARWPASLRGRNSPVGLTLVAVFWTAAAAAISVSAVHLHAAAGLSGYVQAHGLPRTASVVSVQNIKHNTRHSGYYTAQVKARLDAPVTGQAATTVYIPSSVTYQPGDTIAVRVDPRRPGYAELPGARFAAPAQWILAAVVAVILIGLDALLIVAAVQVVRKRHAWRAMPARQPAES
jgi:hypothetical protein